VRPIVGDPGRSGRYGSQGSRVRSNGEESSKGVPLNCGDDIVDCHPDLLTVGLH
jgi:hypothetical protein